jgi:type IV secretion system protein TrbL
MKKPLLLSALILVCLLLPARADVSGPDALNGLMKAYEGAAAGWQSSMLNAAESIFWKLALISLVWTFGIMVVAKADLGSIVAELLRYIIFTGFGWWILLNAPQFGGFILSSFERLGGQASGLPDGLSPAVIGNIGFDLFVRVVSNLNWFSVGTAFLAVFLSVLVLALSALIACNILLVLAAAWILLYAGIVFLGFGGGRWTSEWAFGYYRALIAVGARVMTMELIIGLAVKMLQAMVAQVNQSPKAEDIAAIFVAMLVLCIISDKIPSMVAAIVTGQGSHGLGLLGLGAAIGTIQLATRAAAAGGSGGSSEAANRLVAAIRDGERLASETGNGQRTR